MINDLLTGAIIGAIFAVSVILWGGWCGYRNQKRRRNEEKGEDR